MAAQNAVATGRKMTIDMIAEQQYGILALLGRRRRRISSSSSLSNGFLRTAPGST